MRKALIVLLVTAVASTALAAQRLADFRFGGRGALVDLAPREGGFLAVVADDGLRIIPVDNFGLAQEGRSVRIAADAAHVSSRGGRPMLLWSSLGDTYLSELTIGTTTDIATSVLLGTGGTAARDLACGPSRCAAVVITPFGERVLIADDARIVRAISPAAPVAAVAADAAGFLVIDTLGDAVRFDGDGNETARARVDGRGSYRAASLGTDYVIAFERDGSFLAVRFSDVGRSNSEVRIASGGAAIPFALASDGSQILFVYGPGGAATGPPGVQAIRLDANLRPTGNTIRLSGVTGVNSSPHAAWSEGAFLTAWTHADMIGGIHRSAPLFARVSSDGTVVREGILATGPLDQVDAAIATTEEMHYVFWSEHSGGDDRTRLRLVRIPMLPGPILDPDTIMLRDRYAIGGFSAVPFGTDVVAAWREIASPPSPLEPPAWETYAALGKNDGTFTVVKIPDVDGASPPAISTLKNSFVVAAIDSSRKLFLARFTATGALIGAPVPLEKDVSFSDVDAASDGGELHLIVASAISSGFNNAVLLFSIDAAGDVTRREIFGGANAVGVAWNGVEYLVAATDAAGNLRFSRVDRFGGPAGSEVLTKAFGTGLEVDAIGGMWLIHATAPSGETIGVRVSASGQLLDDQPRSFGTLAAVSPIGIAITAGELPAEPFAPAEAIFFQNLLPKRRAAR